MVEVAPLPPGFPTPAPLEAEGAVSNTTPTPAPAAPYRHPLEAWAEPRPAFEPQLARPLQGGGHVTATRSALATLSAELERGQRNAGAVVHASARETERHDREQEAERQRRGSDPRKVLAAAHELVAEAQAEVDRLAPLVNRALHLVETLDRTAQQHAAVAAAREARATETLIAALAEGSDPPPVSSPKTGELDDSEQRTARAALHRLEQDKTAADDRLARTRVGVRRCAIEVLADMAVDEAHAVLELQNALDRQRAGLDQLARMLTAEGRRWNGASLVLPSAITRALRPADPQLVGGTHQAALTDWGAVYDALLADPAEAAAS